MVYLNLLTVRKWMSPKYWPHGAVAPRTLFPCLITLQCIYFLEADLAFELRGNSQGRLMSWISLWKLGHVLKLKPLCLDVPQHSNPPMLSSNPFFSTPEPWDREVDPTCYLQSCGLVMDEIGKWCMQRQREIKGMLDVNHLVPCAWQCIRDQANWVCFPAPQITSREIVHTLPASELGTFLNVGVPQWAGRHSVVLLAFTFKWRDGQHTDNHSGKFKYQRSIEKKHECLSYYKHMVHPPW